MLGLTNTQLEGFIETIRARHTEDGQKYRIAMFEDDDFHISLLLTREHDVLIGRLRSKVIENKVREYTFHLEDVDLIDKVNEFMGEIVKEIKSNGDTYTKWVTCKLVGSFMTGMDLAQTETFLENRSAIFKSDSYPMSADSIVLTKPNELWDFPETKKKRTFNRYVALCYWGGLYGQ